MSHPITKALCFPFAASLLTAPEAFEAAENRLDFFEKKIRPVLVDNCYKCHSAEAEKKGKLKGKLRLDLLEGIRGKGGSGLTPVVPDDPDKSNLYRAISYLDSELVMPPKTRLAKPVVANFKQWIEMGAPDPRDGQLAKAGTKEIDFEDALNFWSFRKPSEPKLPPVENAAWPKEELDFFILSQLEKNGLRPTPPADKRTLIRRATYDLTGLPPTIVDIETFLADKSPDAFGRVVERLLASHHYGEKWGRHWLDVARYADSNGLDENLAYINAFRYRNYVINSFNEDKPYNRFAQEQIAGDLLPASKSESDSERHARQIATGFLSVGAKMLAEDDGRKMEMDIIDEQIDTIGQTFLGMTIGCARCHDHKYDPLPMRDYYALAGIFKSTKTMVNHKVVAEWHELNLDSAESRARHDLVDKKVKEQKLAIEHFKAKASKTIITEARNNGAEYLIAALVELRNDARIQLAIKEHKQEPGGKTNGILLIEAEDFTRGNGLKTFNGYGKGIGVLLSSGPTQVEFDLPAEEAGLYQLQMRYAAAESRPSRLSINGKLINEQAGGGITGTWYPDSQKWFLEGTFRLNAGVNTLKLDCPTPTPHIDKLLLIPTDQSDLAVTRQLDSLHDSFTQQWIVHLDQINKEDKSPLYEWRSFIEDPTKPIDQKVISNIRMRFAETREKDPLHSLLHDENGPLKMPKDVEKLLAKEEQEKLKQLKEQLSESEKKYPSVPKAMAVTDGNVEDLRIHLRGSYLNLGDTTPRGFPKVTAIDGDKIPNKNSGRLEFARWLTHTEHPLTTRVMVNRIWLWHFGAGIVRTPDNFGKLGMRPTHPALLDWLALRLVENNWSIKQMHRIILNSATYQMHTTFNAKAHEMDPENRLWWRFNRRRLLAEEVRDSVILIGGSMNLAMQDQLMPHKPREYVTATGFKNTNFNFECRSVYLPVIRSAVFSVMQAFDFGDPAVIQGQRASTVSAPQSLFMMNHNMVAAASQQVAERTLQAGRQPNTVTEQIYRQILRRRPTERETERAVAFTEKNMAKLKRTESDPARRREKVWQNLAQVLFSSSEFMFVD